LRIVYFARLQLAKQEITRSLQAIPGVELQVTATLEETLAALPGAQALALFHGAESEARQVFATLRRTDNTVKWLHFLSAGREGYEELGYPPGLVVSYAGGGVAPTVAEHAMALLLALGRAVPDIVTQVMAQRRWDRAIVLPKARSLEGATMAIVGYGHIGRELAQRARPFGMRIVTVSRTPKVDALVDVALPLSRLREALAQADVTVVAIALTPATTHLLGEAEFQSCKAGSLLINVARGPVLDQAALMRALHSGRLGGAGLDVSDPEPLPPDNPLWDCPNILLSPHFAGSASQRSVERLAGGFADNVRRFIAGQPLQHVVSGT
jgi:phosphoglycerate dehydrogenase-like enzyme